MLKNLRIFLLSFVLLNVALGAWLSKTRTTAWDKPLNVVIYAINGDQSEVAEAYIAELTAKDYEQLDQFYSDIEEFFQRSAVAHQLALAAPIEVAFAGQLDSRPPLPPRGSNVLAVMWWSLKLRFWSWRNDDYPYSEDIVIYVNYFDPEVHETLAHSLGLSKGLIGVVNAFARDTMKTRNHVVIAHELLHTLGASDKYDLPTNLPLYPHGYAAPERQPLHPQSKGEIMAGRIPQSAAKAQQIPALTAAIIGPETAREINWLTPKR